MHVSSDHTHGTGEHQHVHSHTHTKAVLNRLARAGGHLEYVRRMVEEGQDCTDVLMQLAAVRSALNNTAKIILKDHIEHCIVDAVASPNTARKNNRSTEIGFQDAGGKSERP